MELLPSIKPLLNSLTDAAFGKTVIQFSTLLEIWVADRHSMGILAHHVAMGTGKCLNMHYLPAGFGSPDLLCLSTASQLSRTVSSEDCVIQAKGKGRADLYNGI